MAFIDDLVTLWTAAGVGVFGTSIFASTKAHLPSGAVSFLKVTTTGGPSPLWKHNTRKPAAVRPTAQVIAVAPTFVAADTLARAAWDVIANVPRNYVVSGGVFYREINPLQEPFDLGPDASGRAQVAFNVLAVKALP